VSVVDGQRLLEVTGVRDLDEVDALPADRAARRRAAAGARAHPGGDGSPEYF
jgi:hypothetical protein